MHGDVDEKDAWVLLLLTMRRFTCIYICMFMELQVHPPHFQERMPFSAMTPVYAKLPIR